MKKYKRLSCSFLATGAVMSLEHDDQVSESLNEKLTEFVKIEKVKTFRIANTETVLVPSQDYSPAYNLICMHIEYEV